jgi:hypothetical protein
MAKHDDVTNAFIHCNLLKGDIVLKFLVCTRLLITTPTNARGIRTKDKTLKKN